MFLHSSSAVPARGKSHPMASGPLPADLSLACSGRFSLVKAVP